MISLKKFNLQKAFFICFFVCICVVCVQCGTPAVFEKNYDLPNDKWAMEKTLSFNFKIEDINSEYNFFYNIRHNMEYPCYNLYIKYFLEDEQGKILKTNLQDVTLFDAKTGKPLGSGLGGVFSHQLANPELLKYKFAKKGNYTFKIIQYMREKYNPLKGIQNVGLRVEKDN